MNFPIRLPAPLLGALALALAGCSTTLLDVGPERDAPTLDAPAAFRDADEAATVREIPPEWWTLYDDPALSRLVERGLAHNQDLAAAAARVGQARALAGQARAQLFPQLAVSAEAGRQKTLQTAYQATDYARIPALLSYEIDLWGAVSRGASAVAAEADAAARRFEAAQLSLSAQVAETVFLLRAANREEAIVAATVETRREARQVIDSQTRLGAAAELDLARADTELASAEAELSSVALLRARLANALALLVGEPAPDFAPETVGQGLPEPPTPPAGLPAEMLRRRPDLAAAAQDLAASADRIGIARAAFLPDIRLTASAGWESDDFGEVFTRANEIWSLAPQLRLPLFEGGRNRARLAQAQAAYEEQLANFRQTALVAFRETQDALAASRLLSQQDQANDRAAQAARRAADLSRTRYDSGYVSYLEVVDSERVALASERAQTQLDAQRLIANVNLIKSLGGGWRPASNPQTESALK